VSWDELDISDESLLKSNKQSEEKQTALVRTYARAFSTDEGQKVIEDLTAKFIYNNNTPINATNINYEAAYHNGEAGVIKYIINIISQVGKI
jgi:O-methyltransferase involved in polyketide biosynthesis